MTLDSGNIRFMRIFTVVLKIRVNFPYILFLRPYIIQTWHAVVGFQVQVLGL